MNTYKIFYICPKFNYMKTKFIIATLVLFCLISCKDEKANQPAAPAVTEYADQFQFIMEITVEKDDTMHFYYTTDGTQNFTEKNRIELKITGSTDPQNVVVNLPANVIPTAIRLDLGFGKNPDQSDIDFKRFKLSYNGEVFEAQGNQVFDYFYPIQDNSKRLEGSNKLQKLDKNQISGPVLYPNENLIAKIKQITTGVATK